MENSWALEQAYQDVWNAHGIDRPLTPEDVVKFVNLNLSPAELHDLLTEAGASGYKISWW